MQFWTTRPKSPERSRRGAARWAALALLVPAAAGVGPSGSGFTAVQASFSAALAAGRTVQLAQPGSPLAARWRLVTLDLAVRLHYDPLIDRNASLWYVRAAAESLTNDPAWGPTARGLAAKLAAERNDPLRLAADADADATANAAAYPGDPAARSAQVDADLQAFALSADPRYERLARSRAAQPGVPRPTPSPRGSPSGSVAPADEYFGPSRLSPLGIRDEAMRIGRYLDAGWGARMTPDALGLTASLDDLRRRFPLDYEVPRLLLQVANLLQRCGSPDAAATAARLRRILLVQYVRSAEARQLLTSNGAAALWYDTSSSPPPKASSPAPSPATSRSG